MKKSLFTSRSISALIGLGVTLIMMWITYLDVLSFVDLKTMDWRVMAGSHNLSDKIVMVGFTDQDIKEIGKWPWDRSIHAKIIEAINQGNPSAIGYDTLFADYDSNNPQTELKLIEQTSKSGKVIYPVFTQQLWREGGKNIGSELLTPFPELGMSAAGIGNTAHVIDPDQAVRREALSIDSEMGVLDSFALAILKQHYKVDEAMMNKGSIDIGDISIPLDDNDLLQINYFGGPGSIPVIPVSKVISGQISPETFNNKIVLVGSVAAGLANFYPSPFNGRNINEIEIQANILNTILTQDFIKTMTNQANMILVVFFGLLMTLIFIRLSPIRGFYVLLAVLTTYIAFAFYLGTYKNILLQIIYPGVTMAAVYVGSVAYGYVLERREKQRIRQTFGRYVAPQVVSEILKTGGDINLMESRRQLATVLFVDMSGFTSLSEKLPPQDLVKVLNKYLQLVIEIIFKYEGTIDKFIGDAVMVEFNAPLPIANHQLKAIQSALEIMVELRRLSEEAEGMYGVKLNASIGINTGEVVIGNIGALNRVEYAAIGDNVNVASRLQSLANAGQILISSSTYDAVKDKIRVNKLGPQKVKGKAQELDVYEVIEVEKN